MSFELYQPEPPPGNTEGAGMLGYLYRELQRIAASLESITEMTLPETYVAPTKPRDGMIRFADGTQWNPGAGRGIYVYQGGAWTKL